MKEETKQCQNCKKEFTIEPDDFSFYEKIKVPPPTWCPECRMIRRFNYRNESFLFRRNDAHSGKEIFSGFSPEAKVITYDNNYWFGNEWDPLENGFDYDFSRPFFQQFEELTSRAPYPARSSLNMTNSDYCNEISYTKNSYLCFNSDYLENCAYLRKVNRSQDCFDSYEGTENELCYEDVMVDKCYKTFFSLDCESCVDVWFSKGLRGCTNCFGCVNLINKTYYYFNEQCTREEYLSKFKNEFYGSYNSLQNIIKKTREFWNKFPVRYVRGLRAINSTGERIFDSRNVKNSYSVRNSENLKFCQDIQLKAANSYDLTVWGDGAENIYECVTCGMGSYNLKFCFNCWQEVQNLEYCSYCIGSKNCFGCAGLYKKEYCILNKQYTKEEYNELIPKIINQMNEMPYVDKVGRVYKYGEFFPFEISQVAYNESIAQDFFPLDSKTALENGYIWWDINRREYKTTIDAISLPDDIKSTDEDITYEIIKCKNCSKAYKIVKMELQFYQRFLLPLPRMCQDCRFTERFKLVNPPKLWHRKCMKEGCQNEFETSYAPDRPEIVYCEKCYQQEVY
ncbi:MAG: hypothetical protein WC603_02500 [Candidatus Paceibacterota bacterium]|jgi:hypothetical protein